jgi:hypothetical protein
MVAEGDNDNDAPITDNNNNKPLANNIKDGYAKGDDDKEYANGNNNNKYAKGNNNNSHLTTDNNDNDKYAKVGDLAEGNGNDKPLTKDKDDNKYAMGNDNEDKGTPYPCALTSMLSWPTFKPWMAAWVTGLCLMMSPFPRKATIIELGGGKKLNKISEFTN